MPYSPPGVKTIVQIGSTNVTLPGGTRILAMIGNADPTLSVSAEQQIQPTSRVVNVNNSGLAIINRVYDYSGPGQSLYVYPTSGAANNFGSGYFSVGDQIEWTPAVNPYPTSTTPAIGATFYANYNYSGVSSNEDQVVPSVLSSGVGNTLDIPNVTAVVTVSGQGLSFDFSGSSAYGAGAGYYLSGNTLLWNIDGYASFSAAANAGAVPSGASTIFVTYDYSGTTTDTLVQNSGYSEELEIAVMGGVVHSINIVSGTNTTYFPSSGTNPNYPSGIDTSGFGISGTGYSLVSGAFIDWSSATNNGYPAATVVPVLGTFYIDYTYNKSASDYDPQSFVDFTSVVNEYGPIADWTLITSGVNIGAYTLARINPLTLAAQIAFVNNAALLTLVQISGAGNSAGYFSPDQGTALSALETQTVDIIVPLTIGDGTVQNALSVSDRALALNYVKLHCDTQSNEANAEERVSMGSLGVAEIGDGTTPNTYIYTASVALDDKRIALIAPGTATIQLQDPSGIFQNINIDGCFLAVAAASFSVSPLNDVATPLTNKALTGFVSISAQTPNHPNNQYYTTEKNNLAAAGCMVIDQQGPNIFIRHQLTTDQSNVINGEFSVVTLIDYVAQAVRSSCKGFIGQKLVPVTTIPAVKGTILATLQTLAQNDIISSIGGITVMINPLNPTELLVSVQYVPIFPLNFITVTFTIQTM